MLDDDFFDLDEDLLISTDFSKKFDETASREEEIRHNLRYLTCVGEDQPNKNTFHAQSFVENDEMKLIEINLKQFHNQKLFDLDLCEDVLIDPATLQSLLGKARMNIQALTVSSRENSTFMTKKGYFIMRQQTTIFLFQLRHLLYSRRVKHNTVEDLLRPFAIYLENLNALPIVNVMHTVHSTLGNDSTSPTYHLLHGHIEWRWLYFTTCLRIELDKLRQNLMISENTLQNTEFEEKLVLFIYDLILISIAKFNKLITTELPLKTPFTCTCVKEMWLLVQLLIERLHENGGQLRPFWHYFNLTLNMHREGISPYATMKQLSISRTTTVLYPSDAHMFSLWLLNGVAMLHGFSENGIYHGASSLRVRENSDLLESVLKSFVSSERSEMILRSSLLVINSLLSWWPCKYEFLMIFWEYFHKKLNSSFYANGSSPGALAVVGKTATEYLQKVKELIDNKHVTVEMSSNTIFKNLLGTLLKRLVESDGKNQIMKITGRILSKFGESKLYALTEVGIHNLMTIFLILASIARTNEIGQRLQSILLQLRLEKLLPPRQSCLMKGHMAMLLIYSEQKTNSKSYIDRLLEQVNKMNADENKLPVLRTMIDALEHICDKSDIFANDEYLLIDSWLVDFLSSSTQSEQEKCLQFINKFMIRIGKDIHLQQQYSEKYRRVMQVLNQYILPYVKQIYRCSNVFSGVPDIAATFCTQASGKESDDFQELFKYFTDAACCDMHITTKFLVKVLSEEHLKKIEQIMIIRMWLKCSTLSTSQNEDIRQLTKIVLNLSHFKLLCQTTENEILNAKDPLVVFFSSCGNLYESASDQMKKQIADLLQTALNGFEKWLPISESPPAIIKIHIVIGLVIFNCSSIVYVRSKPNCFFSVIMNHYILPLPLLMGKPQKMLTIQAVHKIWHLIVGGIERLDYSSDAQLKKVFTDLIVKWIPQFELHPTRKIITKPFTTFARHSKTTKSVQFMVEKLVKNFLSAQRRETHQHAPLVVSILNDIIVDMSSDASVLQVILCSTMLTMMEHAMMVDENLPSKSMMFTLFGNLIESTAYRSSKDIRDILTSNLKTLTTKNLSYYSSFYFQFINKLSIIDTQCITTILPHIREQVLYVEQLRNAGPDLRLRKYMKEVEEAINP